MENVEKIGIENIKSVLTVIIDLVKSVKETKKPLLSLALQIGKIVKINFKEIRPEVKDLDADERKDLILWFVSHGFSNNIALKAINNITSEKRTTILNLAKDLLKSK
jgi:glycosylphosphatidylinositol transamidase (GPIT) subunit GPI8